MGAFDRGRKRTSDMLLVPRIKWSLLGVVILSLFISGAASETEPTESQCREFIEKALKEQQHHEEAEVTVETIDSKDFLSEQEEGLMNDNLKDPRTESSEQASDEKNAESKEDADEGDDLKNDEARGDDDDDDDDEDKSKERKDETDEGKGKSDENAYHHRPENDEDDESAEKDGGEEVDSGEKMEAKSTQGKTKEGISDKTTEGKDGDDDDDDDGVKESTNDNKDSEEDKSDEEDDDDDDDDESLARPIEIEMHEVEMDDDDDDDDDDVVEEVQEKEEQKEMEKKIEADEDGKDEKIDEEEESKAEDKGSPERDDDSGEKDEESDGRKDERKRVKAKRSEGREHHGKLRKIDEGGERDEKADEDEEEEDGARDEGSAERKDGKPIRRFEKSDVRNLKVRKFSARKETQETEPESKEEKSAPEEEELTQDGIVPENLRPRDHIDRILRLDGDSELEKVLGKAVSSTLKTLKGLYDKAIKPLEILYKYRDLSNRHFGDPEIFSKPLILFMGPWSGGKSTTINYLLNNEFSETSLRTGAEPSPAYFNILMHGEEEEVLDGTQLAADWTFSGLQKFGQGLLDRLKGIKLPNKLLEKVNIVEIPGILEIRKQVQRLFPFNDACQWFIDRADIIFLVYDPSKLDVGPETEAILDQLKGRESQTRIILNKADQVKPEELMRVQGTLIWNISPLMSSTEPPIMYSTSLWSMPYEVGAPIRLLSAQEKAFLRDFREAIDKRVENKISSARRFAVRVRNHAKMVDCYLTTYYNHKSFFGNRKRISDDIIENPQKYHIYEGLSTLTNISRYDLPDPEAYRDFFKVNPLYDFQRLSETCTYFRGCPINKLDVVIAYDLPELVGKYRKSVESAREQLKKENS